MTPLAPRTCDAFGVSMTTRERMLKESTRDAEEALVMTWKGEPDDKGTRLLQRTGNSKNPL